MSPVTHFLVSWLIAESTVDGRRARVLVTAAGIAPDIDGLGILADVATTGTTDDARYWSEYHHVLGHNVWLCLLVMGLCATFSQGRRLRCALAAALAFHTHLLMDLFGSRGPDGYNWPIPYLAPFWVRPEFSWRGQWALNAWPNFAITIVAVGATLYVAWRHGHSALEFFSSKWDSVLVAVLRSRFGVAPDAD